MSKFISWKNTWYDSKTNLFVDGIQKGAIVFSMWQNNAETSFEDENYAFKNTGFWQSQTQVLNRTTNEIEAIITYDTWKSKAFIHLKSGGQYVWISRNIWGGEWSLSNKENEAILYKSNHNCAGWISSDLDNNLLVISGLFIKHVYNRRSLIFIACLIPVITSTSRI